MSTPSVPLSMLLTKDVPYEWHDGVALVAQLVAQVRSQLPPGAQGRVPDLRGVTLEEHGTLTLSQSAEQAMPAMPGAAQLLQQLLSGKEQPAPLRLFGMQAATAEPPLTLDAFADELAKWERPNRVAKLAALYFRAFNQIGPAALTDEMKAREDRALVASTARQATSGGASSKTKRANASRTSTGSNRTTIIGALVVAAALIVAGAEWFVFGRTAPVAPVEQSASAPDAEAAAPEDKPSVPSSLPGAAVARTRQPPRQRPAEPPSPVVASAETELARARALFERQEYAAASIAFERVLAMLGTENSPQAEEIRQIARSLAEVAHAAVVEETEAANREYRTGDPGVNDPVPFGYLPTKPDPNTPPDRLQVLEVHVNTNGSVESAKFVMNRPSFRNSWWISAAKAWRFRPATKDGKPVHFVMRIVMDDSAAQK
jgi:hypothetical protein